MDKSVNRSEYHKEWKSRNKDKIAEWASNYVKTFKGFTCRLYSTQRGNSKRYKRPPPNYSLSEFRDWLLHSTDFLKLFDKWKKSNHETDLKPTVDRINPEKPYTFYNIQVLTHAQNSKKGYWGDFQIHALKRSKTGAVGVSKCTDRNWYLAKMGTRVIGRYKKLVDAMTAREREYEIFNP